MAWLYVQGALLEFPGVAPDGLTEEIFTVDPTSLLRHLASTGNSSLLSDAWFIPDVCQHPSGIWRGLNRPGQEQSLCYAGIPNGDFALDHGASPTFQKGRTFLVFLTPTLTVTKWRWAESDTANPELPLDHNTRFVEQLWPKISTDWRNS
jgi:hypothetical protein